MTSIPLEGPHWTFALELYSQPGVADTCLLLQDRSGVDVNVLLLSLFAAVRRGMTLDAGDLQHMDAAVAPWRDEVVVALRRLRRRMKSGPQPAPSEATENLRTKIKSAELHAEQIAQAVLVQWLDERTRGREPACVDLDRLLRTVIAHFAGAPAPGHVVHDPKVGAAMQMLLTAVRQLPSDASAGFGTSGPVASPTS